MSATKDVRNLVSGKDAKIYITGSDGIAIHLGEVDQFQARLNVNNASFQPLGSPQEMAYPVSYKVTVSFSEVVIRDDVMLEPIYEDLAKGRFPRWDIRGQLNRRDGQVQQQTFSDCVPDGEISLLDVSPGDIIKRPWSFISNGTPRLLSSFE